ncbi:MULTISPECIES: hemolysin family protein [Lysobacteraceae]|uniref:HlyC/CorC family transporter n=1 Tax=Novilysobacter avium TaxID=2781023 RepID=A0A7S6UMZ4_9GAMM|nr:MULTISPECIES: hemolysin family protein [Lysobacter]QOW23288.1 HlyC/CorC family transporter [Lysobacter avium]QOW25758.1 HlyC/CorC family transporter [Lysobacter sp. H23M47]
MLKFGIVLVLIAFNAFFALSEMSVVTSRKARLRHMAVTSRRARKALDLAEHPDRFLSTVQVGITLIAILTGMFGGEAIGSAIGAWLALQLPFLADYAGTIGLVIAVGLITYLSIVLGELLPKRLALLAPEKLASFVAAPMHWVSWIATPAVWLLMVSTQGMLKLMRLDETQASNVTEEEIRLLVSESHEQGVIDADERKMMNRVLGLGDRTADSLMTPRTRITWLDAGAPLDDNLETMRTSPVSRFPVLRGTDQDVIGVVEAKSLLRGLMPGVPIDLFGQMREALFVSESTHAMKLLEIFREEQQSIALVVDEYGDVTGLVTLNDVMGAVIGRVQAGMGNGSSENHDETAGPVVQRADGSWLIDGSLHLEDLHELVSGSVPGEEEHDFHTAAGMVIAHFGRIPNVGEQFAWPGWRIEVIDLDGPRIDKLLLQSEPVQDPENDETSG